MKRCLFILYVVYMISHVALTEQQEAQEPPLLANELPIELPADVLQLLERFETAAKAGNVMSNNIVAYLQQYYTPEDITQLEQFAARIHAQVRQAIQGAFASLADTLQAYQHQLQQQQQQQDPPALTPIPTQLQTSQTAALRLLQSLGERVDLLGQLQLRVRAEAPAHIRQQQMHISSDWQTWVKSSTADASDALAAQRLLQGYLQRYTAELDNCADHLIYRVQDHELNVWRRIDALEMLLQQQRVDFDLCLELRRGSEQLQCYLDLADVHIAPHELDDLRAAAEHWLKANYGDLDCFARVMQNFGGAREMLRERLQQELSTLSRRLL